MRLSYCQGFGNNAIIYIILLYNGSWLKQETTKLLSVEYIQNKFIYTLECTVIMSQVQGRAFSLLCVPCCMMYDSWINVLVIHTYLSHQCIPNASLPSLQWLLIAQGSWSCCHLLSQTTSLPPPITQCIRPILWKHKVAPESMVK